MGFGRDFGFDVAAFFYDPNGDYLTFAIADSSVHQSLRNAGIDFYPSKGLVAGTPSTLTTFGSIEFTATDPYGYTASFYLTITVVNGMPLLRQQYPLPPVYIMESQEFIFVIDQSLFVDPYNSSTLIVFAST